MKLLLYMFRWQLSSPILALSVLFIPGSTFTKVVVANIIGSLIFFPVDRWIMNLKKKFPHTKMNEKNF